MQKKRKHQVENLYHPVSNTDLSGSYTGKGKKPTEKPEQDVDDL